MKDRDINDKIALFINREGMGEGNPELTGLLIKNYLTLIASEECVPTYICLYADGVKLACKGSAIIEEFKKLENLGSKIVLCKTCLSFYKKLDDVEVGTIGTMLDIIDVQRNSTKLIYL